MKLAVVVVIFAQQVRFVRIVQARVAQPPGKAQFIARDFVETHVVAKAAPYLDGWMVNPGSLVIGRLRQDVENLVALYTLLAQATIVQDGSDIFKSRVG